MTFELQMLFWTAVLLFGLVLVQGALVPINQGFAWGLGARDEPRDMTALQGRMTRIVNNQIEGLAVFAVLIITAHLSGVSTGLTQLGAGLFLGARVGFAVVYAAGLPVIRSALWGLGATGLAMIAVEVLTAPVTS